MGQADVRPLPHDHRLLRPVGFCVDTRRESKPANGDLGCLNQQQLPQRRQRRTPSVDRDPRGRPVRRDPLEHKVVAVDRRQLRHDLDRLAVQSGAEQDVHGRRAAVASAAMRASRSEMPSPPGFAFSAAIEKRHAVDNVGRGRHDHHVARHRNSVRTGSRRGQPHCADQSNHYGDRGRDLHRELLTSASRSKSPSTAPEPYAPTAPPHPQCSAHRLRENYADPRGGAARSTRRHQSRSTSATRRRPGSRQPQGACFACASASQRRL